MNAPPATMRSQVPVPGAVALVADAHLGARADAAELAAQLQGLQTVGCRRLLLLGDLFHVWVGDPRYETEDVRTVVEALRALRATGVHVDYVEGNRDFFLAGSVYQDAFDTVSDEVHFEAGGHRVLAVHGDGLDPSDRQYRFWRWLAKSALSRFLFFHLPHRLARRAMEDTERRLARTNFKHRQRIPEEAILAYAAGRLAEGFDVLLLGHFHAPRRWQVAGGEVRLLDAWFRTRAVEWIG